MPAATFETSKIIMEIELELKLNGFKANSMNVVTAAKVL